MVEAENFSEEYVQLSTRERNARFNQIFDYLFNQLNVDDIQLVLANSKLSWEDLSHRPDSYIKNLAISIRREHPEILVLVEGRLDGLLCFTETTPYFRAFIKETFRETYFKGVHRGGLLSVLVDQNHLESGGIFDFQQAREIERKSYRHELHQALRSRLELSRPPDRPLNLDSTPDPLSQEYKALHKEISNESFFVTWRQEFIAQYGEEP